MNLLWQNRTVIWLPFYMFNDHSNREAAVVFLLASELLLQCLTIYTCVAFRHVAFRVKCFHVNMTMVIVAYTMKWFFCLLSRLLILPYQFGWISITDNDNNYEFWVTEDRTQMPVTDELTPGIALYAGGFIRWQYLTSLVFSFAVFTAERMMASWWLNDYEKVPRKALAVGLFVAGELGAIAWATGCVFYAISFVQCCSLALTIMIISVSAYVCLWFYNIKVQRTFELKSAVHVYSLAARFQARENARSISLAKRLIALLAVGMVVLFSLFTLTLLDIVPSYMKSLIMLVVDLGINVNPLGMIPVMVSSVPGWRSALFATLPLRIGKDVQVAKPIEVKVTSLQQTEIYFNQFQKHW